MTDNMSNRSPDEIERDIRATQDDMSRTIEQLGGELTGRNIVKSLLDKAGKNGLDVRYLIDASQRNPLALGMIAAGGLWLISSHDAKPSALKTSKMNAGGNDDGYNANGDYASEGGNWSNDSADTPAQHSHGRAQQAATKAKELYFDNPLVSGLAAAIVGAITGSALPATDAEENYNGRIGEKAIDTAQAKIKQTGGEVGKMADNLLDKVDQRTIGASEDQKQAGDYRTA
jgi:hypothetical protein